MKEDVLHFERCQFFFHRLVNLPKINISFHVLLWSAEFMTFAWTVYLALCLSQLHSKQHNSVFPSGIFTATFLHCVFVYSCHALRKSAASPQHFRLCRNSFRELLRSDLWSCACITFHFKPISTWRNSRTYEMWCLAVAVPMLVQQAASFIQIIWTVMQSDFSTWFIQVNTQKGTKTAVRTVWGAACERGIFLVLWLYGEKSTDVETGYTMEHYRNVCQQRRKAGEM